MLPTSKQFVISVDDKYKDIISYLHKKTDYSKYVCEIIEKDMNNTLKLNKITKQIEKLKEDLIDVLREEREQALMAIDKKNEEMINTLISEIKEILATEGKKINEITDKLHENINVSTGEILMKIDVVEDRAYREMNNVANDRFDSR